ncbi:MAG: hypothetical protein ABI418_05415, partial [Jatrophihabitantaceae bacterium]
MNCRKAYWCPAAPEARSAITFSERVGQPPGPSIGTTVALLAGAGLALLLAGRLVVVLLAGLLLDGPVLLAGAVLSGRLVVAGRSAWGWSAWGWAARVQPVTSTAVIPPISSRLAARNVLTGALSVDPQVGAVRHLELPGGR